MLGHNPAVGFGNYIWNAKVLTRWPDGLWLHALWMGGLVGLALRVTALHVLPAALALSRPPGRPDGRQAAAPSWGLACWCILQMIDGLHNSKLPHADGPGCREPDRVLLLERGRSVRGEAGRQSSRRPSTAVAHPADRLGDHPGCDRDPRAIPQDSLTFPNRPSPRSRLGEQTP